VRVVIIGAGIGGLTAAIALRAAGLSVVLYERQPGPAVLGAGLHLWPNALHALRSIGLADAVQQAGVVIERRLMINQAGRVLSDTPTAEIHRKVGAPTVTISRPSLYAILQRATGGDIVRFGKAAAGARLHPDAAEVVFEDGSTDRAEVVVGADGIASSLRKQLLGPEPAPPAGYGAWRTIVDWPDEAVVRFRIFFGSRRVFVSYPVAPGRRYFLATMRIAPGSDPGPGRRRDWLLEQYAGFPTFVREVIGAVPEHGSISHSDLADREPVERWGQGRATLLGDAAHPMTPFTAMGACTAIEDAVVLARALARGSADVPAALGAYERERIPRTSHFVEESRKVGKLMHMRNPVARRLRDLLLPIAIRLGGPRPTVEEMRYGADGVHG
jgi:2-polyprenyl-6-methoxyphenol hydroxylase-like FAD-dependent oxidoreductase